MFNFLRKSTTRSCKSDPNITTLRMKRLRCLIEQLYKQHPSTETLYDNPAGFNSDLVTLQTEKAVTNLMNNEATTIGHEKMLRQKGYSESDIDEAILKLRASIARAREATLSQVLQCCQKV